MKIKLKLIILTAAMFALVLLASLSHSPRAAAAEGSGGATAATVTYNKDIAPILYKNCSPCHRPGEVAPLSLLTYKDAAKRARQLVSVTESRYMPPWKPEPGYGEFHDARGLTDSEIALIKRWADAGSPEGKPSDLQPAPKFTDGWQLGEPDLVLKMPEAYTLKADGPDIYQCFVLPINNDEDKYVSAIEFRPGARKAVHHAILFLDNTGAARRLDAADPEVGYRSFGGVGFQPSGGLGGWAPGAFPNRLPEGVARPVKKGSDVVLQVHYHPTGKVESDQSSIGIYFLKTPPKQLSFSLPLVQRRLAIPAGEKRYKVMASFTAPTDIEVIGVTPHMHLLGREMKVTATMPDGAAKPLIWIKDWNFNWQDQYLYNHSVILPKGTKLEMEAYYDNSEDNPRNPNNPPRRVTWGEQTTDEMALCFVQVVVKDQAEMRSLLISIVQQGLLNRRSSQPNSDHR